MTSNITNAIDAVNQLTQQFIPGRGCCKIAVDGSFVGTLSFKLSQDGGLTWNTANLQNCATGSVSDTSATATGVWLFTPTDGNGGILQVIATGWTAGTAMVSLVDLVATPQNLSVVAMASAAHATGSAVNSNTQINPVWRSAVIYLSVTNYTSVGSSTFTISGQDPVSGNLAILLSQNA